MTKAFKNEGWRMIFAITDLLCMKFSFPSVHLALWYFGLQGSEPPHCSCARWGIVREACLSSLILIKAAVNLSSSTVGRFWNRLQTTQVEQEIWHSSSRILFLFIYSVVMCSNTMFSFLLWFIVHMKHIAQFQDRACQWICIQFRFTNCNTDVKLWVAQKAWLAKYFLK